jgi:hypothetical protein
MSAAWKNVIFYSVVWVIVCFVSRILWSEDTKMIIVPFLVVLFFVLGYGVLKNFFRM